MGGGGIVGAKNRVFSSRSAKVVRRLTKKVINKLSGGGLTCYIAFRWATFRPFHLRPGEKISVCACGKTAALHFMCIFKRGLLFAD